jgi:hypothetical protein
MKPIIAALLLAAAASAAAEPRIASADECIAYADLALVAATLAKHGIDKGKAGTMLPDMYALESSDAKVLARRILDSAYVLDGKEPKAYAAGFAEACLKSGGRIEGFLGVSL